MPHERLPREGHTRWPDDHGDQHRESARRENDEITAHALELDLPSETRLAFVCECRNPSCHAHLKLTAAEYDTIRYEGDFAMAPGHK